MDRRNGFGGRYAPLLAGRGPGAGRTLSRHLCLRLAGDGRSRAGRRHRGRTAGRQGVQRTVRCRVGLIRNPLPPSAVETAGFGPTATGEPPMAEDQKNTATTGRDAPMEDPGREMKVSKEDRAQGVVSQRETSIIGNQAVSEEAGLAGTGG